MGQGNSVFNYEFHPHPLVTDKQRAVKTYWCASCHKQFHDTTYYTCDQCHIYMDYHCAGMESIKGESGQPHIQHFSHQHPMPFVEISSVKKAVCFACQSLCFGAPTYACEKCNYFLHKRCAECPSKEVTHSSHPSHTLCLSINHEKLVKCKCCGRVINIGFILSCTTSTCHWNLCIECFLLPKSLNHEEYYFHSHHSDLTLSIRCAKFTCSLCHISFKNLSCFKCTVCDFIVDVECALMPSIMLERQAGYFRHFMHPHSMTFVDHRDEKEVDKYCFACNTSCISSSRSPAYYSCINCKYFLHKTCAELPLKLNHPLHKHPSLALQLPLKINHHLHQHRSLALFPHSNLSTSTHFCSLCHAKDYGYFFQCHDSDSCKFKICGNCIISVRRSIKYERHKHLLCFVEKVHNTNRECRAYDGFCRLPPTSVELCSTESSRFRCAGCNFNVHLLCGPLPCTIKCMYHIHPLVLVDSVDEDYSGEYYCDICENKRDPRICVYYCQECRFIAHVHCLAFKVISILKGDLRHVELRTVKIDTDLENVKHNKSSTKKETLKKFEDVLKKLPEDEQIMLWCHYDWDMSSQSAQVGETGDKAWIQKLSRFTTEYFGKFIDWLNESHYTERAELKLKFNNLRGSEIAFVEGYMVPRKLARVLVRLLRKHGDIGSNSKSTPEVKSITYSFLCQVLHEMSKTKVRDVPKDHLKEWYFYLNYAQRRDFNVEFIFDRLKDAVRAFIGFQAAAERNYAGDVKSVQDKDIRKLQNELEHLKSRSFSGFVNWGQFTMECLSKALELMQKNVAYTLF